MSTKVRSYGLSPSFTCHGASRVGDLMMTEMAHQSGIGLSANVAPLDQLVIGVEPRTSIEIVMAANGSVLPLARRSSIRAAGSSS
jgi:hypothetical protein